MLQASEATVRADHHYRTPAVVYPDVTIESGWTIDPESIERSSNFTASYVLAKASGNGKNSIACC